MVFAAEQFFSCLLHLGLAFCPWPGVRRVMSKYLLNENINNIDC